MRFFFNIQDRLQIEDEVGREFSLRFGSRRLRKASGRGHSLPRNRRQAHAGDRSGRRDRRTHSSRVGFCLTNRAAASGEPQRRQPKRPEGCEPAPSYFAWGCFRYFGSGPEIAASNPPPHKPASPPPRAVTSAILPSTMWMRRSARAASAGSWVTTTTVWPWSAMSRRIENTCSRRYGIECAGRLVGDDDLGAVGKRTRDGDALALAAGELAGTLVGVLGKSKRAEQGKAALAHLSFRHLARGTHRQQHIVERGELRQQEMELEHEAAFGQADIGPFRFRQFRGRLAADDDLAFAGSIEQAQQIEQRRFARSRRPGNGDELALVHRTDRCR